MSLEPIKRAVKRWMLEAQIRGKDRHIDVLNDNIYNDSRAVRELHKERVILASRLQALGGNHERR